MLATWERCCSI